jgi:hypothetical protein
MTRKSLTWDEFSTQLQAELDARPPPPRLPPRKSAALIGTRHFLHVMSHVCYSIATWDPDHGFEEYLSPDAPPQPVGAACRQALTASRFIPPDHPDFDRLIRFETKEESAKWDELLKARAGVKTMKALYAGSGYIALSIEDGQNIEIKAARHRSRGNFDFSKDLPQVMVPEGASDIELGTAVLKALAESRAAAP